MRGVTADVEVLKYCLWWIHLHGHNLKTDVAMLVHQHKNISLVPSHPVLSVLRFALTDAEEQHGEKRGRPGIIHHVLYVKWT